MCTALLPPGVNTIAVNISISIFFRGCMFRIESIHHRALTDKITGIKVKVKVKQPLVQAWAGPEGSRKFPYFKTTGS
jgi:hypothetical protein